MVSQNSVKAEGVGMRMGWGGGVGGVRGNNGQYAYYSLSLCLAVSVSVSVSVSLSLDLQSFGRMLVSPKGCGAPGMDTRSKGTRRGTHAHMHAHMISLISHTNTYCRPQGKIAEVAFFSIFQEKHTQTHTHEKICMNTACPNWLHQVV